MSLQAASPRLVLASASAARAALLRAAGIAFETCPADLDEAQVRFAARAEGLSAEETALRLAELKARQVAEPEALVIGCDQLLACGEEWFEKPTDIDAAREQLRSLRGRRHTLIIAIVCQQNDRVVWRHVAQPRLAMRDFSDAFLEEYLTLEGDRLTSAVGAYRLEGPGMHLFEGVTGEHAAILGLPMLPLLDFLRRYGVLLR